MASVANSHLEKARSLASTVPSAAKPVLLPAVSPLHIPVWLQQVSHAQNTLELTQLK